MSDSAKESWKIERRRFEGDIWDTIQALYPEARRVFDAAMGITPSAFAAVCMIAATNPEKIKELASRIP